MFALLEEKLGKLNLKIWLVALFALIFTLKFLNTFFLSSNVDPLNYHLAMGKILLRDSFYDTYKYNTHFLMSGIFDYLYIIPNYIFSEKMFAQLMGQAMHFLLSMGLGAFIIHRKVKNPLVSVFGMLILITLARSAENYIVAKNDGFLAAFALLASIYTLESDKKDPFIIGFLLGLLPAIKMTGIFISIPLGMIYVFQNYRSFKKIIIVIILGLITWSPILIRNYYFTHNPFFPGLVRLFGNSLHLQAYNYYISLMGSSFSLSTLWPQIRACFFPKIIFYALPILLFLNFKFKKNLSLYFLVVLIFLVVYVITNGQVLYDRFFSPCYFILAYYFTATLGSVIERIKKWQLALLLLLILSDSKIDKNIGYLKKSYDIYSKATSTKEIVNNMIPFTVFWNHVTPPSQNEKVYVLSNLFTQFYYAPDGIYLEQPEHNFMANFLTTCEEKDVPLLGRYSYAILAPGYDNPCYRKIKELGIKGPTIMDMTFYDLMNFRNK